MTAVISQDACELNLRWVAADPVSLSFIVRDVDWSGSYTAQVRKRQNPTSDLLGTLTVSATYLAGTGTTFVLSMSQALSTAIPAGSWYWDLQQVAGVTRFRGSVEVVQQVTV